MIEPLSLEEFSYLIERHPLIFEAELERSEQVRIQPEFRNFVCSHNDEFERAGQAAVDELRGTGALWLDAVVRGFAHLIELYLGRPPEEHLPRIVLATYVAQRPDVRRETEYLLGEVIE